jgi:hypothetical protein
MLNPSSPRQTRVYVDLRMAVCPWVDGAGHHVDHFDFFLKRIATGVWADRSWCFFDSVFIMRILHGRARSLLEGTV